MNKIFLYEPCIGSDNLGDQIIVDSIKRELSQLLGKSYCIELPTHLPLSNRYMFFLKRPDYKFVCGSNLLVSNFFRIIHLRQWMIGLTTFHAIKGAIFVGVGAQSKINKYGCVTQFIYKYLFNNGYINSVRDSYTEKLLRTAGITNVINTACPTMWRFTKKFCKTVPKVKTDSVVFTLTDYRPDEKRDKSMIATLLKNYDCVYFWPQGARDFAYFKSLNLSNDINIINPSLIAYDNFLATTNTDYVGTRLHGGIRALQFKRRTTIIAIDNRARELKRDFNLPVLDELDINQLENLIQSHIETDINLPFKNIKFFLRQFDIDYLSEE